MGEKILEIKNLCIDFKMEKESSRVVNDLSFSLFKGKTLGIVGESGSGKSVTAMSIMRLLTKAIYSGNIFFHTVEQSYDLLGLTYKDMRQFRGNRIAMVFQEPMTSLNPSMRCGAQINETLQLHLHMSKTEAKKRCLELLEEVRLPDPEKIYNAYPHEISGGQKQRVMIAMAISCKPDILIADEPTTALDVTVQKNILELLLELQKKHGISIVFITHDLGVIAQIAHSVVVMYKGEKVEEGEITSLFTNPQHPYTKGLLACRIPLNKRIKKLPTIQQFLASPDTNFKEAIITPSEWKQQSEKLYESPPILEVTNLVKRYPLSKKLGEKQSYFYALDNIHFKLYEGETLGLVGESGCGKTTLGRSILRLIEIQSGNIIFQGKNISELSTAEMRPLRKDLQIIFQDPYASLNPRYMVGMAILEPMKLHGLYKNDNERKEKIMEILQCVNLEEKHYYHYPHEFSGGQRQRICIARALALNPKIIICDESVSALDVSVQAQVLNLLNSLKEKFNFTYLFISHDLSVVKFMSHRIIVMKNGKIEEINTADNIYTNPQSAYTKQLIDAIPQMK